MKPIIRWTIGPTSIDGFACLAMSIYHMKQLYDADFVICHNNLTSDQLSFIQCLNVKLLDQTENIIDCPIGVAWKLYPPDIGNSQHQLFIDNDLIILKHIPLIDRFFNEDFTLLLEGESRNYGRFEKHVLPGYNINSGIFGIPPNLKLASYMKFFGTNWENDKHSFDEQGLIATALLSYSKFNIISNTVIANCETDLIEASGLHFVGLNRIQRHYPFQLYKNKDVKIF